MNIRAESSLPGVIASPPVGPVGPFRLVDVGASGGIPAYWNVFQPLEAVGFDPLVSNMRKMAAAETRRGVRYEAAFVGCRNFEALFPPEQRRVRVDPYLRASSVRAQELMQLDFIATHFNEGEEVVWSDRHVTLDEYFGADASLDFLKVDTDGSDLQVLLGADALLKRGAFLGIMIEAQFQGWPHEYANVFANLDRLLRSRGFQLYDLDLNRYTRAALPGRFELDITAQTLTGQVLWGDALFFRDLAHPDYAATWGYEITRERLLKLAALFELHGLPDCAAELLLARPDLTTDREREPLLDLLARAAGLDVPYRVHLERFERDPASLFPRSYRQPAAESPPAVRRGLARRAASRALRTVRRILGD